MVILAHICYCIYILITKGVIIMSNSSNFVVRYDMESTNYELNHLITNTSFHINYHNHDYHEILYFISGRLKYIIEGTVYNLRPGDILVTNNKEMHKPILDASKPYERYILWIHPKFIEELSDHFVDLSTTFDTASKSNNRVLRPSCNMQTLIANSFSNLEKATADNEFGNSLLQKSYLTELLIFLNRVSVENYYEIENTQEYDPRINEIIKYINDNLHDQISLDDIAEKFYLSKYHLCRLFKKNVEMTIYQYITKKRLIIAKSLLISGSSVRTAFINSGFSDYSNFVKSFKKEFGVLPKNIATNINRNLLDSQLNTESYQDRT